MNSDQLTSFVRGVLKVAGAALVTHGATKVAAIVNSEDVAGLVITAIGFYLSHRTHSTANNQPTTKP